MKLLEHTCLCVILAGSLMMSVVTAEPTGTWRKKEINQPTITKSKQTVFSLHADGCVFTVVLGFCTVFCFSCIQEAMLVLTSGHLVSNKVQLSSTGAVGFLVLKVAGLSTDPSPWICFMHAFLQNCADA